MKSYFFLMSLLFLIGCSTVTMKPAGLARYEHKPDFSQTQSQFLWGLISGSRINVKKICKEMPVLQMQTQYIGTDVLFNFITLGIYSPRTAKVWCRKPVNSGKPISDMKKKSKG